MSRARNLTGTVSTPASYVCRRLIIPDDLNQIMAVNGAILSLTDPNNWDDSVPGTISVEDQVALMNALYQAYVGSNGCMIGAIFPYITLDPPPNTLTCDGTTYLRVDYPDLYMLLDPAFRADDDHFIVPDLRGLTVIGAGDAESGTVYSVNDTGGEETHELTVDELASHSHDDIGHVHTYLQSLITVLVVAPGEAPVQTPDFTPGNTGVGNANLTNTGSNQPHENRQPFRALNYCVQAK